MSVFFPDWGRLHGDGSAAKGLDEYANPFMRLSGNLLRFYFDPDTDSKNSRVTQSEKKSKAAKTICCNQCLTTVTHSSSAIEVEAQHQHSVTNPAGVTFDIRLFAEVVCHAQGDAISEFSWFKGYTWRIVGCAKCQQHLGWSFEQERAGSPDFYGLISSRLTEAN